MIETLQQYAAEFIAGLAVILSAVASSRAARAEKAIKKTQQAERRMDLLVEIEQKNAAVGQLAFVSLQSMLLLQQHPQLSKSADTEIARLRNNIELLQQFKQREEEERQKSESARGENDIELYSKTLTDIKRLRIRIESEVEKETDAYNLMLEEARKFDV